LLQDGNLLAIALVAALVKSPTARGDLLSILIVGVTGTGFSYRCWFTTSAVLSRMDDYFFFLVGS